MLHYMRKHLYGLSVFLAITVASGCATTPAATTMARVEGTRIDVAAFSDACTAEPGYGPFRAELERVVAARDGVGLRALFDPLGSMRVNGVGGRADTPDWGFGRPQAGEVWSVLEDILALGCARSGERLVLPGMATFAGTDSDQLVVLREETLRREPAADATPMRRVERGQLYTFVAYDTPDGWTSVVVDGETGYMPTRALRSPSWFRLELVPFEASWRIREFGDGI